MRSLAEPYGMSVSVSTGASLATGLGGIGPAELFTSFQLLSRRPKELWLQGHKLFC